MCYIYHYIHFVQLKDMIIVYSNYILYDVYSLFYYLESVTFTLHVRLADVYRRHDCFSLLYVHSILKEFNDSHSLIEMQCCIVHQDLPNTHPPFQKIAAFKTFVYRTVNICPWVSWTADWVILRLLLLIEVISLKLLTLFCVNSLNRLVITMFLLKLTRYFWWPSIFLKS